MLQSLTLAGVGIFTLCFLTTPSISQSIPGAQLYVGGGTPGGTYSLVDDYEPANFFNKFNYYDSPDPTYGHVQYVSGPVAKQNGYVSSNTSGAFISVDTTNKWPRGGPGRPAVRLISDNTYTRGLFVLDLSHMPYGCGTWPAYWLLGPEWPSHGEIDIIEGVNTFASNIMSMHTNANCTVSGTGQTGYLFSSNCDISSNDNTGCGTASDNQQTPNNYGDALNSVGGGVYITEWTSQSIKIWWFQRSSIPSSVTTGTPNVAQFGTPSAIFQGSCNIDNHFANHSIIINTDFCGAFGGSTYSQYPDCPQNSSLSSLDACVDFVGNNPKNFTDAFWQIKSIKVYQMPLVQSVSSARSIVSTSVSSVSPTGQPNTVPMGMGASNFTSTQSLSYIGPLSSESSTSTTSSAGLPTPIICPTYNNSMYTDGNGKIYAIACGLNVVGEAVQIQPVNSFEACMELCDDYGNGGCSGVSYIGGNGAGTCYVKSVPGNLSFDGHTFAALNVLLYPSFASASSAISILWPSSSSSSVATTSKTVGSPITTSSTISGMISSSAKLFTSSLSSTPNTSGIITSFSIDLSTSSSSSATLSSQQSTGLSSSSNVPPIFSTSSNSAKYVPQPTPTYTGVAPTCPASSQAVCSTSSTQCCSDASTVYQISCGSAYVGTTIDTSSIVKRLRLKLVLKSRAIEPDYQACLNLCSTYSSCVAINYEGTNCTLFSSVTGTIQSANNIAGVVVVPASPPSSSVISPASGPLSNSSSVNAGSTNSSGGSPATVTVTITTTLPASSSFGSSVDMSTSGTVSTCMCLSSALLPTVVTLPFSGSKSDAGGESVSTGTATALSRGCNLQQLYTTVFTTHTITACPTPGMCPTLGFVFGQNFTSTLTGKGPVSSSAPVCHSSDGSTTVSTYMSNGTKVISIHEYTTVVSVSYVTMTTTATTTVTTTTVSASVSVQTVVSTYSVAMTAPGQTATASGVGG